MSVYKCIIWDWNGTLLDDMGVCINVMNGVLRHRGLPELSEARYREIFGFPIRDYYERLGFDFTAEPFEQISFEYIGNYREESLCASLREGCIPVLNRISDMGIRQVILSASQKEDLIRQAGHFGVLGYFDELLGLDNCHAASKIELGRDWLETSGICPKEALLIGDTRHDFETASELGCDCVLLSCGHQSGERLSSLGVPLIDSLAEVIKYLDGV
ncbi:MAG TPA: HAD family hydrolase [Clostridia bacterium]|nr:HAD family hydrolase [Clostridia bacterium]